MSLTTGATMVETELRAAAGPAAQAQPAATPIRKVGVIGAGVMGAGIAAQVANAGVPVVLLDIVPGGAAKAIERMLKTDPAPFMQKSAARLVTPGDIEGGLPLLADCDWIVEAIVERPDAKRALYTKLEAVRKPGSIVSSNTSTIPLSALTEGLGEGFAADFLITHFFNPPRYMRLLEVVRGPATRPDALAAIAGFGDRVLGKTVIPCKDRPGFIANRIGGMWMQSAINRAFDLGLTVEEADAVMGRPLGVPKTGVFGLLDLVGIDLMPHVAASMKATLPETDAYVLGLRDNTLITRMIAEGRTGRKGKGGFYTREKGAGGESLKRALDLTTGDYRASDKPQLESLSLRDLRALAEHPDRGGRYARAVLLDTLGYAAALVPEIADSVADVDAAMRLGYNWQYGPFELIDKLGAAWLAKALAQDGRPVPPLLAQVGEGAFYRVQDSTLEYLGTDGGYHAVPRPAGVLLLADIKRRTQPLAKNGSASLWDVGDGVACLEFHSKMNALDPGTVEMIGKAVAMGRKGGFKALVIHNEGEQFSVGANIGLALFAANIAAWGEIEGLIEQGQKAMRSLRDAPFPVVGAPSGMALGGGCEILLHCDAVQAHAETYIGLVEVGVGLIPGWGGCTTMLRRWAENPKAPRGPMPPVAKAFEMISTAQVAKSAFEAKEMLLLRPADGITFNRDRLLADAKARALSLVEGYAPAEVKPVRLPGASGRAALAMAVQQQVALGRATPHDVVVCEYLAETLTGGRRDHTEDTTEAELHALERRSFMALLRTPATLARVEHMLETGRPLRN
ncbi:3-hydroxyacyl-CoA dehydrogenase NAD-binding domain-containing protein [Dankookia sp. GCM10030260]|uniref:3-hydroxyacyl-CoA dehydrogenase/enoyl-CoA hydratase family protein n=1 Tax=Dankookia sp. GCM10030260 TaxID=3273390 RepID=UPI0036190C45